MIRRALDLLQNKLPRSQQLPLVGPIGRHAEASVDIFMQGEIYSYSRSKGVFGGVSLKGTVITSDADANLAYYGKPLTAENILFSNREKKIPESGIQFMKAFDRLAPKIK